MSDNSKLIIPIDKEFLQKGLNFVEYPFIAISVLMFLSVLFPLDCIFSYKLTIFIRTFFIIVFLLVLCAIIFSYLAVQSKEPAAILSKEGIWVRYFGFISWENISEFKTYTVGQYPLEHIGIKVKDNFFSYKQTNFLTKLNFILSKITGYPLITLSNLAISNEQILWFARQYMQNVDHS